MFLAFMATTFLGLDMPDTIFICLFAMAIQLLWQWRHDIRAYGIAEASSRYMDGFAPNSIPMGNEDSQEERRRWQRQQQQQEADNLRGVRRAGMRAHGIFERAFSGFWRGVAGGGGARDRGARNDGAPPTEYASIVQKVSQYPIEAWVAPSELSGKSVRFLKAMAKRRGLTDQALQRIVQKSALVDLLRETGGSSSQCCVICTCDYEDGDSLRILPKCHHAFHVRCIDRWAYQSNHTSTPKCPMCNVPLA